MIAATPRGITRSGTSSIKAPLTGGFARHEGARAGVRPANHSIRKQDGKRKAHGLRGPT